MIYGSANRTNVAIIVAVLATMLLLACGDEEFSTDFGSVDDGLSAEPAFKKSSACPGLLTAYDKTCPSLPGCDRIIEQLEAHGCEVGPVGECPCDANTWWYYPDFNGVYCFAPDYGRLSVCSPNGEEICVANYGGSEPMELDPSLCADCRSEFPVLASGASGYEDTTIESCADLAP